MSCSGGCSERLLKSEVEKWTNDITQLMAHENGRKRFLKFLEDRDLDESLTTVGFITHCEDVIKQINNDRNGREHVRKNSLQKSLRDIVDLAKELDFYENELEKLEEILKEEDAERICYTLRKAKGRALCMLEYEHREFSKFTINEFQKSCK